MAVLGDNVHSAVAAAVSATQGESDVVKAAAVTASATAAASIPPPPAAAVGMLWQMLVGGLLLILLAVSIGIIVAVLGNHNTDVLVTIFTSSLTALIGLFVKSPTQG